MVSHETNAQLIELFKRQLIELNPEDSFSLVLVGSVARGTAMADSDLDLLVLSDEPLTRVTSRGRLHIQYFTIAELTEKLRSKDDFAAWSVRFGIPISNSGRWQVVVDSPEAKVWPEWQQKLPHALRRLQMSDAMLNLGDLDAASEEALYAITHAGRALLLRRNVFPLSRPEMIPQLSEEGFPSLSALLEEFIYTNVGTRGVRKSIRYVKKLLVSLDRDWYREQHRMRFEISKLKRNRQRRTN